MSDKCKIHRGCCGRHGNNSDFLGISDTDVNRSVYPERNFPCGDGRVAGLADCVEDCLDNVSDRRGRCRDGRVGGVSQRRRRDNCLCKIVNCLCGRRRRD